ncbi:hypothetical protein QJS10_CPB15g00653 [Acorus calamus]|uniref:Uncharacterized protein n=1 Tax=Acorus calamus TaxID=4465 RepID=A0AAV9D9A1_ACOCL|nr:hypothetical protein QJS10_CPB15g00653 [Acorus calamus]
MFSNAQFEGAVEPSQLSYLLDLPSHLSKEPSPPDSPAISKSVIPLISKSNLVHKPLIAPIDESLL